MYRATQPGTLLVAVLSSCLASVVVAGFCVGWHPVVLAVSAVLLLVLGLFRSLTIEIDRRELRCFFGDGIIRRRFALSDIASVTPVRNKWYYGWGIRLTPSGWMFNVSGLDAVELTFRSGKRFRIGTDKPQEVVEAFQAAIDRGARQVQTSGSPES